MLTVGPEGNFMPAEVDRLVAAGAVPAGLRSTSMHACTCDCVQHCFECRDGHAALLIVGPKGDFAPAEVDSLVVAGAVPVGLTYTKSSRYSSLCTRRDGELALLIVGPEGDFTPAEVDSLVAAGAMPVGLGPLRLRVETAAIGLLAAVTAFQRSRQSSLQS